VHVQRLSHWYRSGRTSMQVLRDIELEIPPGGYVALTGPSGAGKTTLLALIGGLERPQAGSLRVGEYEVGSLRGDALAAYRRDTIGFVFQHFGLLDLLTARENIEIAAALAPGRGDRRQLALSLLSDVGLAARAAHRPSELSGGERQRLAIARGLVNDPSLILADEPTGNLDSESAGLVLDLLERIHEERGCTLLVVTHNEAVAQRAARRYRLEGGRLRQ
jgi:putative ABC transport system ATP-binding protein